MSKEIICLLCHGKKKVKSKGQYKPHVCWMCLGKKHLVIKEIRTDE